VRQKPQANSSAAWIVDFDDKTKARASATLNDTIAAKT
jgi:hypothetical protein